MSSVRSPVLPALCSFSSSFFLPPRPRLFHRFPFHRPPASLRSPFIPFLLSFNPTLYVSLLSLSLSPSQIFAQSRSSSDSFRLFAKLYGPFLKNSSGHDCQPVDEDANQRSRIIFTSLLISSSSNLIPRNADRKRVIRIPFLSLQTHPRHLSLPLLSKRIPINER